MFSGQFGIKNVMNRIGQEMLEAKDNPARLLRLVNRRYLRIFLRSFRGSPSGWQPLDNGRFKKRSYENYELYLKHQAAKPGRVQFTDHDDHIRTSLSSRVGTDEVLKPGMSVLCLGARFGGEVRAFLDHGCFAIGIDLRTSFKNEYVVHGDFQHVQFPASCVDAVYSNALDHAFDPTEVLGEVKRVLKPRGSLLLDIPKGEAEGHPPGLYESFYWRTADDLIGLLAEQDLRVVRRAPCEYPRDFEHLVVVHKVVNKPQDAVDNLSQSQNAHGMSRV